MRFFTLLLLASYIFGSGCSEFSPFHSSGVVWIKYDALVSQQTYHVEEDAIPIAVVNDFFVRRGYTPIVLETYYNRAGEAIEVICVGEDADVSIFFDALLNLPGVIIADFKIVSLRGFLDEPPEEPYDAELGLGI